VHRLDDRVPVDLPDEGRRGSRALGVRRPLADATHAPDRARRRALRREGDDRTQPVDGPLPTQTTENRFALATPILVRTAHGEQDASGKARGRGEQSIEEPVPTVLATKDYAIATPMLVPMQHDNRPTSLEDPVQTITTQGNKFNLVAPVLVPRYGERDGQAPRAMSAESPMPTIVPTANGAGLVAAFMAQHNTDVIGHAMEEPVSTIVQKGCLPRRLLRQREGRRDRSSIPMRTVTARERFGLVTVNGVEYAIADIGMRMLAAARALPRAGLPDSYKIDIDFKGKPLTKTAQVRMCGNSVVPALYRRFLEAKCDFSPRLRLRRRADGASTRSSSRTSATSSAGRCAAAGARSSPASASARRSCSSRRCA
jgi:hypothetical protein